MHEPRPAPLERVPLDGSGRCGRRLLPDLGSMRAPPCPNPCASLFDVEVDAAVISDATWAESGTSFSTEKWIGARAVSPRKQRTVEHFDTKFVWKMTIAIQTVYVDPKDASRVSCYGRGTTDADVRNRNVTLGFHESCHRADFVTYLTTHPLPALPKLQVGMPWDEFLFGAKAIWRRGERLLQGHGSRFGDPDRCSRSSQVSLARFWQDKVLCACELPRCARTPLSPPRGASRRGSLPVATGKRFGGFGNCCRVGPGLLQWGAGMVE